MNLTIGMLYQHPAWHVKWKVKQTQVTCGTNLKKMSLYREMAAALLRGTRYKCRVKVAPTKNNIHSFPFSYGGNASEEHVGRSLTKWHAPTVDSSQPAIRNAILNRKGGFKLGEKQEKVLWLGTNRYFCLDFKIRRRRGDVLTMALRVCRTK